MKTYTDSTGREWIGNARPEDVEAHCAFERRLMFADVLRARLVGDVTASRLARSCGVTPACVSNVLDGSRGTSPALAERMAEALGVAGVERDRWMALAGHVPDDIREALLAHPERWQAVREVLR